MIMPQPFKNAVMTRAGALLLTRAQAGEIKIEFTRIAIGNGEYEENEKLFFALQERAGLKSLKNSYDLSSIEVYSEHSVKITALITNQNPLTGETLIDDGYFINEMGLYAKEKDGENDTEVLYSIAVTSGESGDFMPPYNGFSAVQIIQEYYATVDNSAEISIQASGAVVLVQDFEAFKKSVEESINGINGKLQWILGILCRYGYDKEKKLITSFIPHDCTDGILAFPEGMAYEENGMVILNSMPSGSLPTNPGGGGTGDGQTGSVAEIAAAAAELVKESIVELKADQVKALFKEDGQE